MRIRPLEPKDISEVADLQVAAFLHDELFTWFDPELEKHPEELRRVRLARTRNRMEEVGCHGFVLEIDSEDGCAVDGKRIAGMTMWQREGNDELARRWQHDTLSKRLNRLLLWMEGTYEKYVVFSHTNKERLAHFFQVAHDEFDPILATLPSRWHLSALAVHPAFHRRGIGSQLLEHGLQFADEERVPVTLNASVAGRPLYEKSGFEVVKTCLIAESPELLGVLMVRSMAKTSHENE
ncbi:acyl-CoA N-acyltransferase [Eremomyces bilateralis CBS 781.70]|uniref:Acyl-CoA N-acyltransferase n=1 Tax=Eremomyces bilateralis CBS 781.70 TaxID=1392243 RepID=A0A6G1G1B6_9PEZI|nr:acyl-CoA N-acyltransferase [Eremomyces bilateralis CBS 781.70]KAF1811833.1 acyl-CoA N-acyltransferase [Eremomyces bilateralis CBS 781.70]